MKLCVRLSFVNKLKSLKMMKQFRKYAKNLNIMIIYFKINYLLPKRANQFKILS